MRKEVCPSRLLASQLRIALVRLPLGRTARFENKMEILAWRMCFRILAWMLTSVMVSWTHAQTVSLPFPAAVVMDGDGKVLGEVVSLDPPAVILNISGTAAAFAVDQYRPRSVPPLDVYFELPDCEYDGVAYIDGLGSFGVLAGEAFVVMGPDWANGTYRVFGTIGAGPPIDWFVDMQSRYDQTTGICTNGGWSLYQSLPVFEIVPNPLEGYHGPSSSHPDRT